VTRRSRWLVVGLPLAVLLGTAALTAVELALVLQRDYAVDPGFDIDVTTDGDGEPLELVVLGDSTVAGLGVDSVNDTMAVQLAREFTRLDGRAVRVRAFGVSGARTRDVLRDQVEQVPAGVDMVVVEIGSNDSTHGTPLGALERDTRALVQAVSKRTPAFVLGGSGPLDSAAFARPLRDVMRWRARHVRAMQARVVRELSPDSTSRFVDMGGAVNEEYRRTPHATSNDNFHPAAAGYGVWARALAERLVANVPSTTQVAAVT
jgi:lysophospholipase L1-like esterase